MTTETERFPKTIPSASAAGLRIIGVGGAGLHILERISQSGLAPARLAIVHTDARLLAQSPVQDRLLLGEGLTRGLGAGGDADIGRAAAEAGAAPLKGLCQGADLVIVATGLGGGTGSGAAPVVARIAREAGALVLGFAALPFDFEGARRQQVAQAALRQFKTSADAVVAFPNQRIVRLIDQSTTLVDTLKIANDMLARGVRAIWRLTARQGLIDVNFADLCHVVRGRQAESCFATAEAMGENRAREAIEQVLANPFLGGEVLAGSDAVLVSLEGGPDLTFKEVSMAMEQLHRRCEKAQVVMGATIDPSCGDRLIVTLVATRRDALEEALVPPVRALEPEPPASEFPTSAADLDTQHLSRTLERTSRFVPPPPQLTPEQAERVLAGQTPGKGRRRKKKPGMFQELLPLEVVSKGRFAKSEPTVHRGEDLDTPTYIRRGVALN